MSVEVKKRDYTLTGPEGRWAEEKGLVSAEWYTSPIPTKRLKELMMRKNGPGIRDTIIWFVLLAGSGTLAYYSWGTWWAIPAFLFYGNVFVAPCHSKWHECGHGTAFKSDWMNSAMFRLVGLVTLKNTTVGRWGHVRHHSDTIVVGRDPEIIVVRPPVWHTLLMDLFKLNGAPKEVKKMFLYCFGYMSKADKQFVPASAHRMVFWESRISMLILLGIVAWSVYIGSILPVLFLILPTFYGTTLSALITLTQHAGLCEDVLDHRLNSRTIYMNRFFRFLYWNMNYHMEHHMYPMVPYHALPALHDELKRDCPTPPKGLWAALKEVYAALVIQRKNPDYSVVRPLPDTAKPYRFGPSGHPGI